MSLKYSGNPHRLCFPRYVVGGAIQPDCEGNAGDGTDAKPISGQQYVDVVTADCSHVCQPKDSDQQNLLFPGYLEMPKKYGGQCACHQILDRADESRCNDERRFIRAVIFVR